MKVLEPPTLNITKGGKGVFPLIHMQILFFSVMQAAGRESPAAEFMLGNQSEDKIDVPLDTVMIEFAIFVSPRESSAALFDLLLALCQISAPKTRRHGGH